MSDWTLTKVNAGDLILDRYEVASVMADDPLGVSCVVKDRSTNQNFMFKQLSFECDSERADKVRACVDNFKGLVHKSIAGVNELILDGTTGYISLEYVEGELLDAHLRSRRERAQILGVKAAYSFLALLCAGLDVVHNAGFAHGALTTKSIIVTTQGRVKLINPVCAVVADQCLDDAARNAYFSSEAIAPEVRESRASAARVSDVYSLALLFCELLCARSFEEFGASPETYIASLPAVPSAVKETLFASVKAEINDRLQDVQSLKDSLKVAVDAPADNDISSIVVGVGDLRSLSASGDMPAVGSQAQKIDLLATPSLLKRIKKEVWIFQKDGLDYGPFDKEGLLKKFYDDDINENTLIYNSSTKEKNHLQDIPEFSAEVVAYLPVRDRSRAEREAENRRRQRAAKGIGGGIIALIVIGVGAAILVPTIILSLMAPPEPLAFDKAFPPFEKTFVLPKVEEVSLNIDEKKALSFFDPEASEQAKQAALDAWEAEHRKKYAALRSSMKKTTAPGGAGDDADEIETIDFSTDANGNVLEPLMDWEIEEQIMNPRIVRKLSECFDKYANGRRQRVEIKFTIQQTGGIRGLTSTAQGELDSCLVSSLSSIKFRRFGGTVKRVTYPLVF